MGDKLAVAVGEGWSVGCTVAMLVGFAVGVIVIVVFVAVALEGMAVLVRPASVGVLDNTVGVEVAPGVLVEG